MSTSPFAPGFGSFPPALAGRQVLLDRVASRMVPGDRENYLGDVPPTESEEAFCAQNQGDNPLVEIN